MTTPDAERVELLPCPFCGGEFPPVATRDDKGDLVICIGCSALGPTRRTESEAVAAWNTRAAIDPVRRIYVRWSDDGERIRKWSWRPFEHGEPFDAITADPAPGVEGLVAGLRDTAKWIRATDPLATNFIYCLQAADALAALTKPELSEADDG